MTKERRAVRDKQKEKKDDNEEWRKKKGRRRSTTRRQRRTSVVVGDAVGEVVVVSDICGAELREVMGEGVQPQCSGDVLAA